MDLATVIGLTGAFFVVVWAILIGGPMDIFIDVPSTLIVVVGSIFIVFIKFSFKQAPIALRSAAKAFFFRLDSAEHLIQKAHELSVAFRKHGMLALESILIENTFMAKGVNMLIDGVDIKIVKESLMKDRLQTLQRHDQAIKIFRAFADVAPAMGMVGTLIGLVQMLSNMSDPDAIGPAMAVAILTTLYGALIANVVATPIADKLSLRSDEEDNLQALVIDALENIATGVHPDIMKDTLQNYLPTNQRTAPAYGTQALRTDNNKAS